MSDDILKTMQEKGQERRGIVADPLFVDLENGDFRLQPDSPAVAIGFRPITAWGRLEEHAGPRRQ